MKDPAEAPLLGVALQRRTWVGDRDELLARLIADLLGNLGEEIILKNIGLGGAAGFAGDNE
jgi:hypothetical protein